MFPTMELLLRHGINYLQMKRNRSIASSGVLDNEQDFISDIDELSLGEARAVLCIHMLCYVLDGSIAKQETKLWVELLKKVEEKFGAKGTCSGEYVLEYFRTICT